MACAEQIIIGEASVSWQDITAVARRGAILDLSDSAWARIDNAQAIVQRIVANGERAYGVNTGLGALCNVSLQGEQLSRLSRNTLLSHACGVGPALPDEQTRAIICAAIINYSQGKSGIHRQVVQALLAAQALEFFKGPRFGVGTEAAWRLLRERVPAYDEDRWLAPDIASSVTLLRNEDLLETVFQVCRDYAAHNHHNNHNSHRRNSSATSAGQAGASFGKATDITQGVAAS